jgi:hypothetical protein
MPRDIDQMGAAYNRIERERKRKARERKKEKASLGMDQSKPKASQATSYAVVGIIEPFMETTVISSHRKLERAIERAERATKSKRKVITGRPLKVWTWDQVAVMEMKDGTTSQAWHSNGTGRRCSQCAELFERVAKHTGGEGMLPYCRRIERLPASSDLSELDIWMVGPGWIGCDGWIGIPSRTGCRRWEQRKEEP